jgi:hypothetical protein
MSFNIDLKMKNYLLFFSLILILSCDDALFDSGSIVKKEYKLEDFSKIYIEDIFDVFLIQDTICKLELEGGDNLLPNIDFKVKDEEFHITNENGSNWSRNYEKIKVYISLKNITFLKVDESANLSTIDTLVLPKLTVQSINDFSDISLSLNCNSFYFVNEGTSGGYITLKGKANSSGIWARGSCIVDAQEFKTIKTNIKNESIGDCKINVSTSLEVEILRSGDVLYKGNPETITYINEQAKEQLIKLD